MSGVIATLGSLASVASAVETLAFGSVSPIILGEVEFQDFEVPATISLPVKQAATIHKLIGGDRVVDAMGPDYGDIAWSGTMLGATSTYRAQALKALVDTAQPVSLTWGQWSFTVFAAACNFSFRFSQIAYSLRCTIIRDDSAAQDQASPDLTGSVAADLGAAFAASTTTMQAALSAAQSVVIGLSPIIPGSSAVASALGAINTAQGVVGTTTGTAITALNGISSRAGAPGAPNAPVASMADLGVVATQSGPLAQGISALAYLGRAAANLTANL